MQNETEDIEHGENSSFDEIVNTSGLWHLSLHRELLEPFKESLGSTQYLAEML
jgi:hypothetical protein